MRETGDGRDVSASAYFTSQGTQTRSFAYDLAGRLVTARNPETGTTATQYAYDRNGNMYRRQDARGVVLCYGVLNGTACDGSGYDALNRPLVKRYYVPPPPPGETADAGTVTYCYDGRTYSNGSCSTGEVGSEKGLLTSVGMKEEKNDETVESSTDYQHDLAGRVSGSTQRTTGLADKPFSYRYYVSDFAGSVTYPSNKTVVTCSDDHLRPLWVSGSKTMDDCVNNVSVGTSEAYASGLQYGGHGLPTQMTLGNGLNETTQWSTQRLQPTQRSLGSLWTLGNDYGTATANNGN
jgi:YD repeat-containing protein